MQSLKNKKIKIDELALMIICFALFVFSQELRNLFGNIVYTYNILFILSIALLFLLKANKINTIKILGFLLLIIIYIISASFYEKDLMKIIGVILLYLIPLFLVLVEVESSVFINTFKLLLKILTCIIIIITVIGILEEVFGLSINTKIATIMSNRTKEQIILNSHLSHEKRLYSFLGHPLFNTQIYLMYLNLAILYHEYIEKKQCPTWVLAVVIVGLGLTASKTGLILLAVTVLFIYKNKTKKKKFMIILIGLVFAAKLGIFETVIDRFQGKSLTSGRSEMWDYVQSLNLFPLKFFTGYGKGFTFKLNNYLDWASAAYEYPPRMFALEYGILISGLMYIFLLAYPLVIIIKRRQWKILLSYLIIFIDVNTFNGLSTAGDKIAIFCFFIFIILNLSLYLKNIKTMNEKI